MVHPQRTPSSGLIVLPNANIPTTSSVSLTRLSTDLPSSSPLLRVPASLHVLRDASHSAPQGIVQIVKFSPKHGSWLVAPSDERFPPHLVQNGHLTLVTTVDPLFVLLPFIPVCAASSKTHSSSVSRASAVFQPADALSDLSGIDLSVLLPPNLLRALCESKIVHGVEYFRLSSQKALKWLLAKHDILLRHSYVEKSYALNTLVQYVTPEWDNQLQTELKSCNLLAAEKAAHVDETTSGAVPGPGALEGKPDDPLETPPQEAQASSNDTKSSLQEPDTPDTKPKAKAAREPRSTRKSIKRDESAVKFWAKRTTRSSTSTSTSGKRQR